MLRIFFLGYLILESPCFSEVSAASIRSLAISAIGAVLDRDLNCRDTSLSSESKPSGQLPSISKGKFRHCKMNWQI